MESKADLRCMPHLTLKRGQGQLDAAQALPLQQLHTLPQLLHADALAPP